MVYDLVVVSMFRVVACMVVSQTILYFDSSILVTVVVYALNSSILDSSTLGDMYA